VAQDLLLLCRIRFFNKNEAIKYELKSFAGMLAECPAPSQALGELIEKN
jgi:hypothetical protein